MEKGIPEMLALFNTFGKTNHNRCCLMLMLLMELLVRLTELLRLLAALPAITILVLPLALTE